MSGALRTSTGKLPALIAAAALAAGVAGGCGARTGLPIPDVETTPLPECPGLDVQGVRLGEVEQMDLLFVIDNSASMADKQALLRDAIPVLVRRLANPLCVNILDPTDEVSVDSSLSDCPDGYRREFKPIDDMHVGVITTSLGGHGGDACSGFYGQSSELDDDRAHLLATRPRASTIPTYQNLGFLDWDPRGQHSPPGENDIGQLEMRFEDMVTAAGENGCGLESTLESWYRFLIDPKPDDHVEVHGGRAVEVGTDETLLAQRAAFLRPDSLVAVVMLSDENDCSIIDGGLGWIVSTAFLPSGRFLLPRATSTCADDPNNPCCRSCGIHESAPPAGCSALADDPSCKINDGNLKEDEDGSNLRCFHQKQRFGFDLLYPTARYAVGLRSRTICPDSIYLDGDCTCRAALERAKELGQPAPPCTEKETGKPVKNPLFSNLTGSPAFERDSGQVFLAGIVGVPWQDIATRETLNDPERLEYMTASQLSEVDPLLGVNRWDLILGDLDTYKPPQDPFMQESVEPRSGSNPVTGDPIVASTSIDPEANAINGHEHPVSSTFPDLQYACIFPLAEPRSCDGAKVACDCDPRRDDIAGNPLCQPPGGGTGSTTQYFAKAYPGLRELDVLRRHGGNAVAASICPKNATDSENDLGFGYRPAVSGLIKRLRCATLDADFQTDPTSNEYGTIECRMVAVTGPTDGACSCDGMGRLPLDASDDLAMRIALQERGRCGANTGVDCGAFCLCQIPQTTGSALTACQNDVSAQPVDASGARVNGWCYIDPARGFGSPELVDNCPAGNLHNVRLLGSGTPRAGESLFVSCGSSCETP